MKTSANTENLVKALLKAQMEFPVIPKDKQGQLGNRKYMYADLPAVLDAVRPILHKNGLILQHGMEANGHSALSCRLSHVSGEWQESDLLLPTGIGSQDLGSAITYERRYTTCAMLGIATEDDDDGAAASAAKKATVPTHPNQAAPEGGTKPPQASSSSGSGGRKEQPQSGPNHRGRVVKVYEPKSAKGPHGIKLAYEGSEQSHNTFSKSAVANATSALENGLDVEFGLYENPYDGRIYFNVLWLKVIEPEGGAPDDSNIPF